MDPVALRPRSATEIVDAAVEVYRRNPIQFLLLTAIVHVPWMVLQIILVGNRTDLEAVGPQIMIGAGTLVTWFLISGLVIQLASDVYLGEESDAVTALRKVGLRIIPVFLASVIQGTLIILGLLFFLFPAVWISAVVFAVSPAIVLEGKGVFSAFSRSSELSKGIKMHVLGALGLVVIIRLVVQIGITLVIASFDNQTLRFVIAGVASILVYPVMGIADALIYYDARIRKEGFDIEVLAARTEPPPAALTL